MCAKRLKGLDSSVYEHPFDRKALKALKAIPGFDKITNFYLNWTHVKWSAIDLKGSNFHVTETSCPELYDQIREIGYTLDLRDFPEIYTKWGYYINAFTTGIEEDTLLVLYSGAVDLLQDDELSFIIGHEMGHIKSRHVLYHSLAINFSKFINNIPVVSDLIVPALLYWSRMSEFTADRAGLLACQDEDAALRTVMKMAGVPQKYFESMDRRVFLEQAKEFEDLLTGSEKALKGLSSLDNTHPWTILRAAELIKWIESGEYGRILEEYSPVQCPHCRKDIPKGSVICPYCDSRI
jgi:hypothetical protein